MIITEIKRGKRGCYLVFGDEEYLMSVKAEVLIKSGIKVGKHVDEDTLAGIKKQSDFYRAKEKALNLLSYRGRSKKELKDRLSRDADEKSVDMALQKMESLGLINDESFAMQYAEELLLNKRVSLSLAKYKLREKGISDEIIEKVFLQFDINEEEQVLFLLRKKYLEKMQDEKSKTSVVRALMRRGYNLSTVKRAFSLLNDSIIEDETI